MPGVPLSFSTGANCCQIITLLVRRPAIKAHPFVVRAIIAVYDGFAVLWWMIVSALMSNVHNYQDILVLRPQMQHKKVSVADLSPCLSCFWLHFSLDMP
jgi:hypothetical protein